MDSQITQHASRAGYTCIDQWHCDTSDTHTCKQRVGLSTSCLQILLKLLKKGQLLFVHESCSKVAPKKQTKNFVALFLIWFDAKVQQKEISKLSIVIQSNSNFKSGFLVRLVNPKSKLNQRLQTQIFSFLTEWWMKIKPAFALDHSTQIQKFFYFKRSELLFLLI